MRLRIRLAYVGLILLLFAFWAGGTQYAYHQHTGTIQLSAARGWQRSNNMLYAYAHVPQDTGKNVEYRFRKLQALVNHQDSVKYQKHGPDESIGNYYIEDKGSPLYAYMRSDTSNAAIKGSLNRWLLMGPFYSKYADWLMKQHHGVYFKHFVISNTMNYFVPEPEYTGYYFPFGITDSAAVKWFHLSSNRLYTYQNDKRILFVNYMPGLLAMSSLVFLLGFIAFGLSGGFRKTSGLVKKMFICAMIVELLNLVFSVSQTPLVLRYQLFPFVVAYSFGALLLAFLLQESKIANAQTGTSVISVQ